MNKDIYQQNILDHYHYPRNYGRIKNATYIQKGSNLACGDEITFYLKTKNHQVKEIKFEAQACAICTASASILTEQLLEKTLEDIFKLKSSHIKNNLKIALSPIRLKCALLPLTTLKTLKRDSCF